MPFAAANSSFFAHEASSSLPANASRAFSRIWFFAPAETASSESSQTTSSSPATETWA